MWAVCVFWGIFFTAGWVALCRCEPFIQALCICGWGNQSINRASVETIGLGKQLLLSAVRCYCAAGCLLVWTVPQSMSSHQHVDSHIHKHMLCKSKDAGYGGSVVSAFPPGSHLFRKATRFYLFTKGCQIILIITVHNSTNKHHLKSLYRIKSQIRLNFEWRFYWKCRSSYFRRDRYVDQLVHIFKVYLNMSLWWAFTVCTYQEVLIFFFFFIC